MTQVDPWPGGGYPHPSIPSGHRAMRAICFAKSDTADNGYAKPIHGIIVHLDITARKVCRADVSSCAHAEFLDALITRASTNPPRWPASKTMEFARCRPGRRVIATTPQTCRLHAVVRLPQWFVCGVVACVRARACTCVCAV